MDITGLQTNSICRGQTTSTNKPKPISHTTVNEILPRRLSSPAPNKINKTEGRENKGKHERPGNINVGRVKTPSSSSSVEETSHLKRSEQQLHHRQNHQRPVAPSSLTFRSQQQPAPKKSSTSTAIPAALATGTTETSASETGSGSGISFLRNNFPFFRNSTNRSRSQSVISDVSRSSEAGGVSMYLHEAFIGLTCLQISRRNSL